MPERLNIAIIGGGCSGALAALHLLRDPRPARIHLIEPRAIVGTGMAYSTDCPQHLLNVPARCMSVSPATPGDFVEWLRNDGGAPANPDEFISRQRFGRYVADRLETSRREARPNNIFEGHHAEVLEVGRQRERAILHLNNRTRLEADFVVLALGNAAPRPLPFFPRAGTDSMFYESAWSRGALAPPDPHSDVALVGSGLTAVDAFLALRANGHRGVVHMISRRGLLPQPHVPCHNNPGRAVLWESGKLRDLVRQVRERAAAAEEQSSNWRDVINSLRQVTNELWQQLTPSDRERFYRHVKPYWDAHRHRMAPQTAAMLNEARRSGGLEVHSGRIQRIAEGPETLKIHLLLRSQKVASIHAQRAINCTGSEQDYRRVDSPLLRSLFSKGWLSVNPPGLGVRTTDNGAVVDRHGAALPWLFAIGPMRVGGRLETTAVPEIREQAAALAETLLFRPAVTRAEGQSADKVLAPSSRWRTSVSLPHPIPPAG